MTPNEALHDLTLALIYLTRISERQNGSDLWDVKPFQAWKNYNWDTVDELDEEGLVSSRHGNKSLWLTTVIQVFNDMNTVKPENVPAA